MPKFIIKQAPWFKGKSYSWYISCISGGYLLNSLKIGDNCSNGGWYATREEARKVLRDYQNKVNNFTYVSNRYFFNKSTVGFCVYRFHPGHNPNYSIQFLNKYLNFTYCFDDAIFWHRKKDAVEAQQEYLARLKKDLA